MGDVCGPALKSDPSGPPFHFKPLLCDTATAMRGSKEKGKVKMDLICVKLKLLTDISTTFLPQLIGFHKIVKIHWGPFDNRNECNALQ